MATRFWVGGTGNWDGSTTTHWAATTGGLGGASVPTSGDTVTFDTLSNATAYTVTITATANCSDLTVGAPLSGKVTFAAGSAGLNIFGSMNMSGGTAGITWNFNVTMNFSSTATGKTITTNGITILSNTNFNGIGGGWTLQDNFTTFGITHTQGTLDFNGKTVSANSYQSIGAGTRTLTLGASNVTFTGSSALLFSGSNFTFNANTSTITCSAVNPSFAAAGATFNNVVFSGIGTGGQNGGDISGANTFANLTITGTAATLLPTIFENNQTITGTLTLNGNSTAFRLFITSLTPGTPITLTAATVSVSYADFMDITGAGAGSWDLHAITGLSGDCGGNSGITFTTPVDQHWQTAAGGNWSSAANWTSRIPLPQDNVFMDKAFSTSRTVTADMPLLGKNIDWTGATWTTKLTFTSTIQNYVFGSYILISGLTYTANATNNLILSTRGSSTLSSNAVTINQPITIQAPSGTYTLGSDTTMTASRLLSLNYGTLTAVNGGNNYIISTGSITMLGTFTLTLGSATHLLNATGNVFVGAGTINANTSTIKMVSSAAGAMTWDGGGLTFNNVWFSRGASAGNITIVNSNTFNDLKDDGTVAHSLRFTAGTTQTMQSFHATGSSGNVITINSTSTSTHALVLTGGGVVSCDWLNIQHSVVTPGTTWYAGTNSTDNQATSSAGSGWIFTAPPVVGSSIKTFDGLGSASVKTVGGLALALVKTVNGLA